MIAAMTWIKVAAISALVLAVAVLWLKLEAELARNDSLSEKLQIAADTNQTDKQLIASLKNDNGKINALLVERQRNYSTQEARLNEDIRLLGSKLKSIDCYGKPWPSVVADKLCQPY